MVKRVSAVLIWALFILACTSMLSATDSAQGTADQAQAMVEKASKFLNEKGTDVAYKAFTDKTDGFVLNDLYIFVVQYDGLTVAHGGNPKIVGKNMLNLKDSDGKLFIQEMINLAQKGGGWVDYKWVNPQSKKIEPKSTYVKAVDGMKAFYGCGIYK